MLVALLIPFLLVSQCCCQGLRLVSDQLIPLTEAPKSSPADGHPTSMDQDAQGDHGECCDEVGASNASGEHHDADDADCAGEHNGASGHCPATQDCPCSMLGHGFITTQPAPTLGASTDVTELLTALPSECVALEAPTCDIWLPATDLPPPRTASRLAPDTGRAPPCFS